MELVTIRAHFDGQQILLDEPCQLEPNTKLMITVLSPEVDAERVAWSNLSIVNLSRAYDRDEPEYPLQLIKEANPE